MKDASYASHSEWMGNNTTTTPLHEQPFAQNVSICVNCNKVRLNIYTDDGKKHIIKAGSGEETGMKWLMDETNCLIIKHT